MKIKTHKTLFLILLFVFSLSACRVSKDKGFSHKNVLTEQQKEECLSIFMDANKEKILGNYSRAGSLFAECIRKNPNDDASFYELASILILDKKYDDALMLAREALRLDPKNLWYQVLLAEIYNKKKQPAEAAKIYKKIIKIHPEKIDYYYELAMLYIYAHKYKDAIAVYDKLEKITGVSEELAVQKQSIYMFNKNYSKAAEEINKLIAAFPKESRYKIMLADVYLNAGQKEKAFKIYETVQKEDPQNGSVNFSLAEYYRDMGQNDKFFEQIKLAFSNQNVETDAKIKILLSYFSVTENENNKLLLEQAFELLDILIKTHPGEAIVYSMYADFLIRDKQNEKAETMFLKVVELDNSKYAVWEQLLITESDLHNYVRMDSLGKVAIELFPEQPLLYLLRGFANYQLEHYEEAVKVFKEGLPYAIFNNKLRAEFFMYIGDIQNILKNYPESDAAYDNALKIDSNNVSILNNYSYYLSLRGENLEKARIMSKKSNVLKPDVSSYQDTYAWVLYCLGEYNESLIWIEKALSNNGSKNAVIVEHYGDILYKLNKKSEALEQWKKAKEIGKGSEALNKKIETGVISEQ